MKKLILYVLWLLFIASILCGPLTLNASVNAISIWFNTLLPSFLFPLILARLLSPYHLLYPILKPFNNFFLFCFNINSEAMECIITALFLGFPSASIYLYDYAEKNRLPFVSKERLLTCIFCASPNFILISLSSVYSINQTRNLFIIQLLCIFLLLLFSRKTPIHFYYNQVRVNFHMQLKDSITQSFQILGVILAYLLIVYVIIDLVCLFPISIIRTPLKLLSEFSSGCFYIASSTYPTIIKSMLTNIILAYGGLCVHMQILSTCQNAFHYSYFIKYRIIHMLFALLFTLLFYPW